MIPGSDNSLGLKEKNTNNLWEKISLAFFSFKSPKVKIITVEGKVKEERWSVEPEADVVRAENGQA